MYKFNQKTDEGADNKEVVICTQKRKLELQMKLGKKK